MIRSLWIKKHIGRWAGLAATLVAFFANSQTLEAGFIYDGHEYFLTSSASDWLTAEAEAIALGGHLVAINNSAEQEFLETTFGFGEPRWIGLTDEESEGNFQWSNGDALTFTKWKPGEPNDAGPGEDYVTISWEFSITRSKGAIGTWNDTPLAGTTGYGGNSDGPYFGIIERDHVASTVPEPSSLALLGIGGLCSALAFARRRRHPARYAV